MTLFIFLLYNIAKYIAVGGIRVEAGFVSVGDVTFRDLE
ncbi:MAG: RNA polymerase sporulation sigma factor SigH, partial [Bacillus mycoides]